MKIVEGWAKKLTKKQLRDLVVALVERGIVADDIHFWDDAAAPYWESCGEPLVDGQKCYFDD